MRFLQFSDDDLEKKLANLYKKELEELLDFCVDFITPDIISPLPVFVKQKAKRYTTSKKDYEDLFFQLFSNSSFRESFLQKLTSTQTALKLYNYLVWETREAVGMELDSAFSLNLYYQDETNYGTWEYMLDDELSLIVHHTYYTFMGLSEDRLFIKDAIRELLRYILPVPKEYDILAISSIEATKYSYNNEQGVFKFLDNIEKLLENNLVEFGKTNEKPLAKSLNIIYTSSDIKEFYTQKKLNLLSTDMLTRSFYFYYNSQKRFRENYLETLKDFIKLELDSSLPFFISRIFTSHLKKVRFDEYYTSETNMFDVLKSILNSLPKDSWVDIENIIKYCKYRELEFHLESSFKTKDYYKECDILTDEGEIVTDTLYLKQYYHILFFEPVIKALFFYMASLGIVEIKYNDPVSPYNIKGKDLPYISFWDGLRYIKFTELGLYILGIKDSYEIKEQEKKSFEIRFDEYKPIITVDKNDSITIAKLEAYTIPLDNTRYILDYNKIFRDCKSLKELKVKIDGFYTTMGKDIPKVFKEYFASILSDANMLSSQDEEVVIKLKNNKKLLSLFLTNKKLQELIIKASGYRVIVNKKDLPKFNKIVKDNGFFIEF